MSQGFDELEYQLKRAVRARRRPRPPWMRRGHRRTWAFVAIAMLVISAGALAATRLAGVKSTATQGTELAVHAVIQTAHLTACQVIDAQAHGLGVTEGAPAPAITRVLPWLNTPVSAGEQGSTLRGLARSHVEGVLLTRTLRTIAVSHNLELLVAVGLREGRAVRDPAACAHARVARAERLARNRPAAVLLRARSDLAHDPATAIGVQTLYVFEKPVGANHGVTGGGGSSEPVWSGHRLTPGLQLVSGRRDGSRLFVGIVAPGTVVIRVRARERARLHVSGIVHVVQGFFAVKLPRRIGAFSLLEVAADGTVLRRVNLRQ